MINLPASENYLGDEHEMKMRIRLQLQIPPVFNLRYIILFQTACLKYSVCRRFCALKSFQAQPKLKHFIPDTGSRVCMHLASLYVQP